MRSSSLLPLAALLCVCCTPKARIEAEIAQAPSSEVVVSMLDMNSLKVLDTVKTDASGRFRYSVEVQKGRPEFVYLFRGERKLASLLLSAGETAVVKADTLGHYEVSGSPESEKLCGVEASYAGFIKAMDEESDPRELSRIFIDHYRENLRYIASNPRSLTVIPVLYQQLDEYTPVFFQFTDAVRFRAALDSLKPAYPDSPYVQALEKETRRRESALQLSSMVQGAERRSFPELSLPSVDGERKSLSAMDSKAVLIHFWDPADAAQKMFNLDVLLPLWNRFHSRGLDIYSVAVGPEKSLWASVVEAQKTPWTNVCAGRNESAGVLLKYNVGGLPSSYLLINGEFSPATIDGEDALRRELEKALL